MYDIRFTNHTTHYTWTIVQKVGVGGGAARDHRKEREGRKGGYMCTDAVIGNDQIPDPQFRSGADDDDNVGVRSLWDMELILHQRSSSSRNRNVRV